MKQKKDNRCYIYAENTRCFAMKRETDSQVSEDRTSLELVSSLAQWRQVVEKKAYRGRRWKMMGTNHFCAVPRNEKSTRVRGWIRQNTRTGPVLNIKVCYRDERCSIEVQVPSLFQDNTVSWVRIVNGVDEYVTESMPTAKEEDTASGKPIAKARPRQKPTVTLT